MKKAMTKKTTKSSSKNSIVVKACSESRSEAIQPSERTVTLERRASADRRKGEERRKASTPVAIERRKLERRAKVSRRRQIDPTTCEREYTQEEIEFMGALDAYKRASGRMFPTCSEVLEVIRKLGYEKRAVEVPVAPVAPIVETPVEIPAATLA
jgi:hypothetical protein